MRSSVPKNFNPHPFEYHQEIELFIENLTNLGFGIGRYEGWVVMVPFCLPGERVKVRIFRNHKNYSDADLVEVLEKSPHRVEPVCPLFGQCGGCQYQHYAYSGQLEWKRRQVEDLLTRIGCIDISQQTANGVSNPHPSPRQYAYRSKITPHFQKPPKDSSKQREIGFLRMNSRRLIDVDACPIATDAINAHLPRERKRIQSGERAFRKGGTLLLRDTCDGVVSDMKKIVTERVGDLVFQFQAGEFFQNNPFILPEMVAYVVNQARNGMSPFVEAKDGREASPETDTAGNADAAIPGTKPLRYLVDCYCGVGVFALSAAATFEECLGVEVSSTSVTLAGANASLNKVGNCRFLIGKAEVIFGKVTFPPDETAVIIDPPRKGCDVSFLDQLFQYKPARVVYVSCDPATQMRDLKLFVQAGYDITEIQPFDLFPQTRHIENITTLELRPMPGTQAG